MKISIFRNYTILAVILLLTCFLILPQCTSYSIIYESFQNKINNTFEISFYKNIEKNNLTGIDKLKNEPTSDGDFYVLYSYKNNNSYWGINNKYILVDWFTITNKKKTYKGTKHWAYYNSNWVDFSHDLLFKRKCNSSVNRELYSYSLLIDYIETFCYVRGNDKIHIVKAKMNKFESIIFLEYLINTLSINTNAHAWSLHYYYNDIKDVVTNDKAKFIFISKAASLYRNLGYFWHERGKLQYTFKDKTEDFKNAIKAKNFLPFYEKKIAKFHYINSYQNLFTTLYSEAKKTRSNYLWNEALIYMRLYYNLLIKYRDDIVVLWGEKKYKDELMKLITINTDLITPKK